MRMAAYFGDVPEAADAMAEDVAATFGGSTVLHGHGRWFDDDRNLFVESAHIVETYTADTVDNRRRFQRLAALALAGTDELAVMVTFDGENIFVNR